LLLTAGGFGSRGLIRSRRQWDWLRRPTVEVVHVGIVALKRTFGISILTTGYIPLQSEHSFSVMLAGIIIATSRLPEISGKETARCTGVDFQEGGQL
jgi:hypothetical protein